MMCMMGGVWEIMTMYDIGGRGVSQIMTMYDEGGEGVWTSQILYDVICEQPLSIILDCSYSLCSNNFICYLKSVSKFSLKSKIFISTLLQKTLFSTTYHLEQYLIKLSLLNLYIGHFKGSKMVAYKAKSDTLQCIGLWTDLQAGMLNKIGVAKIWQESQSSSSLVLGFWHFTIGSAVCLLEFS